tara:strand:+ start:474 stop:1556 length:1083 start_codon:yes stop_codon:yes gene_type:complete
MIENENLFNILNKLDDAVIITDRDKKIIFQNEHSIEIFENDYTTQIITNLIRDPEILDSLDETIAENTTSKAEYSINRNISDNTGGLSYEVTIYPGINDNENNFIYIILKNISIQRNSEKIRASFVANVSHELKTPLSTIIGFIETIRTTAKNDENSKEEFLNIINDEANRMDRLIDDLLTVSKIESNEHVHPTTKINLSKCLERIQKNLTKKLSSKNMRIQINSNMQDHHILGNEDELIQLFSNLFENSFKYGNNDSEINVSLQKKENKDNKSLSLFKKNIIEVKIEDQSDGIPAKHLHRLTERFFRVDKSRSKSIEGTGLGLTIVKHILNKHRGNLLISSTINKGSVFTIQLPEAPIS